MVSVCFYFQVHQPCRMRHYTVFDINKNQNYFDAVKNREIIEKVAKKCYLPTNQLMLDLINEHDGRFKIAYSMSGVILEQLELFAPQVIQSFKDLVKTGKVELLSETYHHSLAFLYSKEEFKEQVEMHKRKIKKVFGYKPEIFRNTELIYSNEMAKWAEKKGYKGILAEGADKVLGWRSPNFIYKPHGLKKIKLLLKNYKLSDDVAFRFSNKGWEEHPLTVDKYVKWINKINGNGNAVNLFMDYETFGEHQWEDTGIFNFMRALPGEILKHPDNDFKTPSEIVKSNHAVAELDIPYIISWADLERDLSAWLGNKMQQSAIKELFDIEKMIKKSKNKMLLEDWRKLTTSDHFYYMCTKWFSDGDVHKYFNPYDNPYDAYIIFMNILNDLIVRSNLKSDTKSRITKLFSKNK